MNGAELYALSTAFLGDNPMDEDIFYQLINLEKARREMMRDWVKLRAIDTSITFTSANDYTAGKTLPTGFLRTYTFTDSEGNLRGPRIIRSDGSYIDLKPIKLAERYDYKDIEGYYYIDHKNGTIGRTGTTAGTLHLPYLKASDDIDAENGWTMPFSENFGVILVRDVVISQKGEIDWDRVNASQIPYSASKITQLESALNMWDARLQQAEIGV